MCCVPYQLEVKCYMTIFTDLGLSKESVLVPYTEDKHIPPEESYNFITECFFLAHQALNIGYSIVYKVLKLSNDINRLDKLHSEIKDLKSKF